LKESIAQIKGSQYRYHYDPETKATKYLGPVGDAPELGETEFIRHVHRGIADVRLVIIRDKIDRGYFTDTIMVPVRTTKNPNLTVWVDVKESDLESPFAVAWAQVNYDDKRGRYIDIADIIEIKEENVIINEDDKWVRVEP